LFNLTINYKEIKNTTHQKSKYDFHKLKRGYFIVILLFSLTIGSAYEPRFLGHGYNFCYAEIILMMGMTILIIRTLFKRFFVLYSNDKLLFSWIFLTVWMTAILLWSIDPLKHLAGMIAIGEGLLAYIIVINLFYSDPYSFSCYFQIGERLFIISLVVQLFVNMWPLLMYDGGGSLTFYGIKEHAITAMGKSNLIAIYLEFALFYELIRRAKYYYIFVVITIVGLIMTFSRAGLIITFIMIFVLFIKEIWKLQFKRIFIYIIVSLCLGVVIFTFMEPFIDILKSSIIDIKPGASLFTRIELWKSAWTDFSKAPLFGSGLSYKYQPHNTILRTLVGIGIIGSIPFFIILLLPIKKLIYFILLKRNHLFRIDAFALLIAYSAVFLHSLVEIFIFGVSAQIWLGIIFAYVTIITNQYNMKTG
jgi:O-antigen ligase